MVFSPRRLNWYKYTKNLGLKKGRVKIIFVKFESTIRGKKLVFG
jgi:hypothetical protein